MSLLMRVLAAVRPGVNCADVDGTLAGVRYDAPLPQGFTPPTQAEIDAAIARLDVPEFVRSGDFFHALIDLGWYDQIDAAINSMVAANHPDAKLAKVLWDKASRFERSHPLLIQIATAIGKTSDDLDALFRKTLEYA